MRMRNSSSNGSKCKSLALSLIAISKTMFSSLRTGALSARASTLVRSIGPSPATALAAAAKRLVGLHVGDDALDAFAAGRIEAIERLLHVALGGHHRANIEAEKRPQFVLHRKLLRIARGDRQRVAVERDRDHLDKAGPSPR